MLIHQRCGVRLPKANDDYSFVTTGGLLGTLSDTYHLLDLYKSHCWYNLVMMRHQLSLP